jgi:hypothetical protein
MSYFYSFVIIRISFFDGCIDRVPYLEVLHHPLNFLPIFCHVYQGLAEVLADLLQQISIEVTTLMDSLGWPAEASLTSVTVNKIELSPHDNSTA